MKPATRTALLGLCTVGTLLILSNVLFWGLTTFVVFTVLRWMGIV